MKIQYSLLLLLLLSGFTQCKSPTVKSGSISDEALMDTIQRRTFNYFWHVSASIWTASIPKMTST